MPIGRVELVQEGLLHPRTQRHGGPFYTIICPGCQSRLVAEASGDGFLFRGEWSLPRVSALRRALRFFLGMPPKRPRARTKGRRLTNGGPGDPSGAGRRVRSSHRFARELEILGLPVEADLSGVRTRYKELAKRLHPDRFTDAPPEEKERIHKRFVVVKEAYERIVREWGSPPT